MLQSLIQLFWNKNSMRHSPTALGWLKRWSKSTNCSAIKRINIFFSSIHRNNNNNNRQQQPPNRQQQQLQQLQEHQGLLAPIQPPPQILTTWYAHTMVIFARRRPRSVMDVHRPIESVVVSVMGLVSLPVMPRMVPPGFRMPVPMLLLA
jgi:hypothetical protein